MIKPLHYLTFICLLCCAVPAFAQQTNFYVSPHVSTQGLGVDLKLSPLKGFNIRAGASAMNLSTEIPYTVREQTADAEVKVDMGNAHLLLDVHPFIKSNSFARKFLVTAGMAYFWELSGDAEADYTATYDFGGNVGIQSMPVKLTGAVEWKKYAPYLGFGFENPAPKRRVNVGFALGAYYLGKPSVNVNTSEDLPDAERDKQQFRDNVRKITFLPVLQFNLNIRI
jgi:hypothetical protein